jgi:2-methylcitrate dehydratase
MASVSTEMAAFAHNLEYDQVPEGALLEAKRFLLDSIGCALAAVPSEDMRAIFRYIEDLGGAPQATAIGKKIRTSTANAALANGLLIRALDYNDIYWEQDPSHPSDLLGVALASAEANHKSGKELLLAIIIAYELEMRWCHAADPGIREVGWHHATLTQFVSPLVAGRLYDLSPEQMTAAVGISGSSHFTLGGVVAGHLTNMKNMADPLAAQAGVHAALMARQGISGPVEVIEGKEGLAQVLSQVKWRTDELLRGLGEEFIIQRCSYKAFPSEALTHQPITAALQACAENNIKAEEVENILVETTTRGADILSDPSKYAPKTRETADHSLPYVIAVAVADGNVLPGSFGDEKLKDPRILGLLQKIKVVADPEIDALFPKVKRARVTITARGGKQYVSQVDHAKGSPQNPMSDADIIAKFHENAKVVMDQSRRNAIIGATMNLEEMDDVGDYLLLLAL